MESKESLIQIKKLSNNIERLDNINFMNNYIFKFRCSQYLENIDDVSNFTSFNYNKYKQEIINTLVEEFRLSLNNIIFENEE